jgi:hypothetical protein
MMMSEFYVINKSYIVKETCGNLCDIVDCIAGYFVYTNILCRSVHLFYMHPFLGILEVLLNAIYLNVICNVR